MRTFYELSDEKDLLQHKHKSRMLKHSSLGKIEAQAGEFSFNQDRR